MNPPPGPNGMITNSVAVEIITSTGATLKTGRSALSGMMSSF